jgi:hypothetical protein
MMALLLLLLLVLEWGFFLIVNVHQYISIFHHEFNTTTIQCIKTFAICMTLLQLSLVCKVFFLSGPAMRIKALEGTIKIASEVDFWCMNHNNDNYQFRAHKFKAKWKNYLYDHKDMDAETKAAVKEELTKYVKNAHYLKDVKNAHYLKDWVYFIFAEES